MALVASHLNSYKRPETGWAAPLELGMARFPAALFEGLGMELVAPDEVTMSPALVAHVPGVPGSPATGRASYNGSRPPGGRAAFEDHFLANINRARGGTARAAHTTHTEGLAGRCT